MIFYKKLKKVDIKDNFTNIHIFELYFNLLMLRYKHYVHIQWDDTTIELLPYDKRTTYIISNTSCDESNNYKFITPIMKHRIVFKYEDYILDEYSGYTIEEQLYKNINVITHKKIMKNYDVFKTYLGKDDKIITYLNLIDNDKPAIEVLIEMGKILFDNTDEIKVNSKNVKVLKNENKKFDLSAKIPPIKAYTNKNFCYPRFISTGRPISYMIKMCNKVINFSDLKIDNLYLPVMRYQNLYYQEKTKHNYKGTFYYIEPNSTVLLDLGKCCVFSTKVEAYIVLQNRLNSFITTRLKEELEFLSNENELWKNLLLMNISELYDIMTNFYTHPLYNESDIKKYWILQFYFQQINLIIGP